LITVDLIGEGILLRGDGCNRLRFPCGSPADTYQPCAPHKSRWPPAPTLDELTAPLLLKPSEEVYDVAPWKCMPLRSKENQDAVDLCFGLVALALRSMVEESLRNRALSIELPKQFNIRRFQIHSQLSSKSSC
jgi:hypothetical protein